MPRELEFTRMRILLVGMSNMLSSIVTAVIEELPDSIVVGRTEKSEGVSRKVRLTNADVIMLQEAHPDDVGSFAALLRRFPALRVVAITADGGTGYLHELRPCSTYLPELSVNVLEAALHSNRDRIN